MLKLWLIKPAKHLRPYYDVANGFVVRAYTEDEARQLAANDCGDEGVDVWLNYDVTQCTELTTEGEIGVILRDFNAG